MTKNPKTIPAQDAMPEEAPEEGPEEGPEAEDKFDQMLELLRKIAEKVLGEKEEEESPAEAPVADASALIAAKVGILQAQAETKKAMVEIARFNRRQTIDAFVAKLKDENRAFDEAAVRAQCEDFVGQPKMWSSYQATIEAAFPRAPGAGSGPLQVAITVDAKHPVLGAFASDPDLYQKAHAILAEERVQKTIAMYPDKRKDSFARELVGQLLNA